MAENGNLLVVIIGYLVAILFPLIGLIYGILLYFMKKEEPYYAKHAKYIMIVAVVMAALSVILASMMGLAMIPIMASS